ncbi:isochorismatase family protein [Denitromonas iodatirespirans]|uniref:Isochorismatase family protein n=1 Tax=Denitromonas iodatirespirans TaxID=2795389 RepID=A0A944DC53_DENI1|nr:isochorismatase family protein [Denitromonas iodatirespirans]MBT0960018.1 isochorismatase family protein [Denitromonas iodatirespirans]
MSHPARRSALILIDIQDSFRHMPFWSEADLPAFRQAVLALDAGCRARDIPVVHIFHVGAAGPFTEASGHVHAMDWLPGAPAATFHKHTHNAFTDTGLDLWLRRRGIDHLIIAGIRTEQCCETTARVGADIGYSVDFVTEATLTFPMTHAGSGRSYSADEIKAHTELVLAGRFARIVSATDALAALE